ncbi:MAG: RNA polymerase sigma factor [Reichenbachiella sp.]
MSADETKLIKACLKGNRQAQAALYQQHAGRMFVICKRYTKAQQEAEDILQESFIKVFKELKSYKGDSPVGAWIKRIVINTALNSQRSKLYMYPMVDVDDLKNQGDGNINLSEYSMEELLQMINELPESCQVIFNLYAIEGYKHKEIAALLKINEGTSKSQYSRAKQLLQNKMKESNKNYGRG